MQDQIEQFIRTTAYQLWVSAGCPQGSDERFWDMARDISGDVESLLDHNPHEKEPEGALA